MIASGKIKEVNAFIGNYYTISGSVIHGNHLGRTLGFPTANIKPKENASPLPGKGVYVVYIQYDNVQYKGIANIGNRPTIEGKNLTLEVHIFNFDRDLYSQLLTVSFLDRIRNEVKFNSLFELASQIEKDKKVALDLFARLG